MANVSVKKPQTTTNPNSWSRPVAGRKLMSTSARRRSGKRITCSTTAKTTPSESSERRAQPQQHHGRVEQLTGGQRPQRQGTRLGVVAHVSGPPSWLAPIVSCAGIATWPCHRRPLARLADPVPAGYRELRLTGDVRHMVRQKPRLLTKQSKPFDGQMSPTTQV